MAGAFRLASYDGPLFVAPVVSDDERAFVLRPPAYEQLRVGRYIMRGDKVIHYSTVAVVAAVAAVAAVVSHRHALQVVTRYGETGLTGALLPDTVDGVV